MIIDRNCNSVALMHPSNLHVILFLFLLNYTIARNEHFSFTNCDKPRNDVFTIDGADISSQTGELVVDKLNCTMTFQAKSPYDQLLLQINEVNVAQHSNGHCADQLSIYEQNPGTGAHFILNSFCGAHNDLPSTFTNGKLYTNNNHVSITWQTGSKSMPHGQLAFKITITAVTQNSQVCPEFGDDLTYFRCSPSTADCISPSLRCDGLSHCYHGEDESGCTNGPLLQLDSQTMLDDSSTWTPVVNDDVTTESPLASQQLFLWLPLIVVIIFTAIMIGLIIIGRRKEPDSSQTTANQSTSLTSLLTSTVAITTTAVTTEHYPGGGGNGDDELTYSGSELIYMLVLFVIFIVIVVACLMFARKDVRRDMTSQAEREALGTSTAAVGELILDEQQQHRNGLSVDTEGNAGYEPEPGQPQTPPPSYSILERQISYVSHISQSSSQIEEPPDYTDALDLPVDENGDQPASGVRSVSMYASGQPTAGARRRSAGSAANAAANGPPAARSSSSRLRSRLFSRSVSAAAAAFRRADSSSSSADRTEAEVPSSASAATPTRTSDASDVFIDLSQHHVAPQGHSTPHPSSDSSSQHTSSSAAAQTTSSSLARNSSHLTTISSIDEVDVGSSQSIFEHIQRLNAESQMSDDEIETDRQGERDEITVDETDVVHSVSRVALLTDDGAPNTGVNLPDV